MDRAEPPQTPPSLPKTPPPGFGFPEKRGSIAGDTKCKEVGPSTQTGGSDRTAAVYRDRLMRAEEARSVLVGLLRAEGVEHGRCGLTHVWPAVRRWLGEPVDGPVGEFMFECVALSELPTQASLESKAEPDHHEVFGLELVRELVGQPMVAVNLYFSIDDRLAGPR